MDACRRTVINSRVRASRGAKTFIASFVILSGFLTTAWLNATAPGDAQGGGPPASAAAISHGRQIWFENTYGGERFFAFLAVHPDPARRIRVGFDDVLATPRATRFDTWGTINDPDCTADPQGGPDVCADPSATGVIGIRKFAAAGGGQWYGVACAFCHAGFDPLDPPLDANAPAWNNIHPTIGNTHLKTGEIFATNLTALDPRRLMFLAWPHGTDDTTLLFSDSIMNPAAITPIWELKRKPSFDVGLDDPEVRFGHGGEDDLGLDVAVLRKYSSLGVCFAENTLPAIILGQPLSIDGFQSCADAPPQGDLDDLVEFLESQKAPQYAGARNGKNFAAGKGVFNAECATCHDSTGPSGVLLSNDEVNAITADAANATNACRALTTNWDAGRLWAEFSSAGYKARAATATKGYRTAPLAGIWTSSRLLHNESIGLGTAATALTSDRIAAFEQAMQELLSASRTPIVKRTPLALGPFPAGTPLTLVFSRDPVGALLCSDVVENGGHFYGANLAAADKAALIEFLKFQ